MKLAFAASTLAVVLGSASAFTAPLSQRATAQRQSDSSLSMVLEKPKQLKKLSKLEILKVDSDHLLHPLKEVS